MTDNLTQTRRLAHLVSCLSAFFLDECANAMSAQLGACCRLDLSCCILAASPLLKRSLLPVVYEGNASVRFCPPLQKRRPLGSPAGHSLLQPT